MKTYRRSPTLLMVLAAMGITACQPTAPGPNDRTLEVHGGVGATGSGLVSIYSPRFQPGAQHIGTCVLDPGSAPCTYVLTQTSGTLELLANSVGGSTFTGWGVDCASATGNSCLITLDASSSFLVVATFAEPTVQLPFLVSLTVQKQGNPSAVLQSDQGHSQVFSASTAIFGWYFELPIAGGDIRLSVQPNAGTRITYLGVNLMTLQRDVVLCDSHSTFATSCTFQLRPNELLHTGSEFRITVHMNDDPVPPPPGATQRYVATNGGDGSNLCTDPNDPCLTMQRAILVSATGDVINVANGTYNGIVDVDKAVSLKGESRTGTILHGQFFIGGDANGDLSGDVAIQGFSILPGAGANSGVRLFALSQSSSVTITQVGAAGFDRGVDGFLSGGSLEITSSAFSFNNDDGIHLSGSGDVSLGSIDVIDNNGDGIQFSNFGDPLDAARILITGARVQGNEEAGVQVETMRNGLVSLAVNCIVANGQHPSVGQAGVTLSGLDGVSVAATGNNITGNLAGGVSVGSSTAVPNFKGNWWGNPAGPSGTNNATGNVDVSLPAAAPIAGTCQ